MPHWLGRETDPQVARLVGFDRDRAVAEARAEPGIESVRVWEDVPPGRRVLYTLDRQPDRLNLLIDDGRVKDARIF